MPDRFTEVFLTWKFLGDETQSAPHTGARAKRHGDESHGVIPNPEYILGSGHRLFTAPTSSYFKKDGGLTTV